MKLSFNLNKAGFTADNIDTKCDITLDPEKGEITLYEWIPVRMKLHGLFENDHIKKLHELFHGFSITHHLSKNGVSSNINTFQEECATLSEWQDLYD